MRRREFLKAAAAFPAISAVPSAVIVGVKSRDAMAAFEGLNIYPGGITWMNGPMLNPKTVLADYLRQTGRGHLLKG